jgi:hypothetical protein
VACLAAIVAGVPIVMSTSTLRRTSAAGVFRQTFELALSVARLRYEALILHPAPIMHASQQSLENRWRYPPRKQHTDSVDLPRLLRLRPERPGEGPSQRGQQEAPAVHYSITWSAVAPTVKVGSSGRELWPSWG